MVILEILAESYAHLSNQRTYRRCEYTTLTPPSGETKSIFRVKQVKLLSMRRHISNRRNGKLSQKKERFTRSNMIAVLPHIKPRIRQFVIFYDNLCIGSLQTSCQSAGESADWFTLFIKLGVSQVLMYWKIYRIRSRFDFLYQGQTISVLSCYDTCRPMCYDSHAHCAHIYLATRCWWKSWS